MRRLLPVFILCILFLSDCASTFDLLESQQQACRSEIISTPFGKKSCEQRILGMIQNHSTDSFSNSPLQQKLAEIIARIYYEPMSWPSQQYFWAFKDIPVPNRFVQRFHPNNNDPNHQDSDNIALKQKLVDFLLTSVYQWSFKTQSSDNNKNLLAFSRPFYTIDIYDSFWKEHWIEQIGTLFHEVEHFQSISLHIPCTGTWNHRQSDCDATMDSGRWGIEILISELLIQGILAQLKSPIEESTTNALVTLVTVQCLDLQAVNEHSGIPKKLNQCKKQNITELVQQLLANSFASKPTKEIL